MAEFNANIVVQPYNIDVTLTQPGITVNPDVTSLNIYAVGGTNGQPAGNVGDLQYYAANGFAGVPSNVANYASGNLNLNVANTKISGGTNGYVLQTDGAGNISWTAQSGGGGNGSPGGSNTQIQYNDSGLFGGSSGFTFDKTSNLVSMPGNLTVAGNISGNNANFTGNITAYTVTANVNGSATTAGTVTTNAQPNITSVGTLTGLTTSGTIDAAGLKLSSSKISLGQNAGFANQGTTGIAIGFEAGFTNQGNAGIAIGTAAGYDFQGSNAIAIGYYAGYPGNAIGQGSNSIAIGSLAGYPQQSSNSIVLNASGANLPANIANSFYAKPVRNANTGNILFYNQTTGEITYDVKPASDSISNGTSNVSIPTANGNVIISSAGNANIVVVTGTGVNVAGTLNVTGLMTGNAGGLSNVRGANVVGAVGSATTAGTVTAAAQPNITSVGTLTSLAVSSTSIALGNLAGNVTRGGESVSIGNLAGFTRVPSQAVAIGTNAIRYRDTIGAGVQAVAIGAYAGYTNIGNNAIAIGANAGYANLANNAIVLNATGANLDQTTANTFTVKPIRPDSSGNLLFYNDVTGEITYGTSSNTGGSAAGNTGEIQFNSANVLSASPNLVYNTSNNTLVVDNLTTGNYTAANINFGNLTVTGNANLATVEASGLIESLSQVTTPTLYVTAKIIALPVTFATLPAFATTGWRAFITDANTTTFNAIVGGGGANRVPVFHNGTNWRVG